jgi:hypothetical protein
VVRVLSGFTHMRTDWAAMVPPTFFARGTVRVRQAAHGPAANQRLLWQPLTRPDPPEQSAGFPLWVQAGGTRLRAACAALRRVSNLLTLAVTDIHPNENRCWGERMNGGGQSGPRGGAAAVAAARVRSWPRWERSCGERRGTTFSGAWRAGALARAHAFPSHGPLGVESGAPTWVGWR